MVDPDDFLLNDDYPSDELLQRIAAWTADDLRGLFEEIRASWHWPEHGAQLSSDRSTYRFATGGWSGNESLIGALGDNGIAWLLTWEMSRRGGLHVFVLPEFVRMKGADDDMTPDQTTPTSDGSSEREALIDLIVGMDHDATSLADLILAAGFTRAHGETVARLERDVATAVAGSDRWRQAAIGAQDQRDAAIRERDALAAKLAEAEKSLAMFKLADGDEHRARMAELRADAAEQRAARLAEALRDLIDDEPCWYDHHGYCQTHNLGEKPCAMERARTALAGNAARHGEAEFQRRDLLLACHGRITSDIVRLVGYPEAIKDRLRVIARLVEAIGYDPTNPAPPAANAATKETPDGR